MKIGILTFHGQLNYGGVLQCWALKRTLEGMGHEVVVVDRWLTPDNRLLDGPFGRAGLRGWCVIAIKSLLGCGTWKQALRYWRTRRFVQSFNLTPYHFYNWSDLESQPQPFNLNIDLLVVGSDQVWHCGDWGNPRPYLLQGAPSIRAISYAASFGMKEVPADRAELYKGGLGRFAALSCREREGIEICKELGFSASWVVDPSLLLPLEEWKKFAGSCKTLACPSRCKRLVCYFLRTDLQSALPALEAFTRRNDCEVEVLVDGSNLNPAPRTLYRLYANWKPRRVKICRGYGPREFVRAFAAATWTLTDSFHAVMFSAVFNCNARFLLPRTGNRKSMFARIEEFATSCIEGDFFANNVEVALQSFERGGKVVYDQDWISEMSATSKAWLKEGVAGIKSES